jgi:trimethylamine--corrinoid protein Co-methyltransferase
MTKADQAMNEPTTTSPGRRRDRSRGARQTGAKLAPMRRLEMPWKPLEIFDEEQLTRILDAAWRVLEEHGIEMLSPRARDVLRANGADVDESTHVVRIGRDVGQAFLAHAPAEFVMHARNPERDMHVGGRTVNFGPVNGVPHVTDLEKGRRYSTLADLRDILKVTHALGVLHWQGGVVCEPTDIPVPVRHLEICRAHIDSSDTVWAARGIGSVAAMDAIRMAAIEHGMTPEKLVDRPVTFVVTNVNSPRRVDKELLDGMMTMAEYGQGVCVTPFTLMGAMAPVTLAGALVQQTAEAISVAVLIQMVRRGAPVIFGGFTSNVDMRTGSPAFGTPEYVQSTLGGAQIARALKMPSRSSACCASPAADAQAVYETSFSLWASIMSHSHMIMHAAGWVEGGLAASFEKVIIDAEMLRSWEAMLRPVAVTDEDLAVDAIASVPPGGHFFGAPHTLARYEHAFWRPILSDWSNFENWRDAGARDATMRAHEVWKKTLAGHVPPPLDPAISEELDAFTAKRYEEIGEKRG